MALRDILSFLAEDPYEYFVHVQSEIYAAREVRGVEGLSTCFRFESKFRMKRGDLPEPEEIAGNDAEIRIMRSGVCLRRLFGVVSDVSISATASGDPEVVIVVEPRLSLLKHRKNSKVFRNKTVPEIVAEVLHQGLGLPTVLRLRDDYKRRPYTVMYNEREIDFVHRLLEDEGIFYRFMEFAERDEGLSEEEAKLVHAVMLCDGTHAYEPIEGKPSIDLRATGGMARPNESIFDLRRAAKMRPGKVSLRDWNLEKPRMPMDVSADIARFDEDSFHGPEYYDYPGKYELPDEGARKARLIAEAFACTSGVTRAKSDTARLVAGRSFEMVPDQAFLLTGIDAEELVVTRLEHRYQRGKEGENGSGDQGAELEISFEALPSKVAFRPLRTTHVPTITNPLTGIVTGPAGEDIYCDELGRVKVQFHWDRYQMKDENVSHWIPVLQDNTGTSTAIPRIGWEVVVAFVDGDPDRPYVLGRVYNQQDVFPEPLPAAKTKTALRSLSSPTRDGHNEIWIEDAAGKELMSLQAEKDMNVVVANDKTEKVLNQEENTIEKDETITIGANNTVKVSKQQLTTVQGNQSISVMGSRSRSVGQTEQNTVAGARSLTIGASHIRKIGGFDNVAVESSLSEGTGGVEVEVSLKKNSTNSEILQTLTVGGAVVEVAGQGKEEKSEMFRVETIGAALRTVMSESIEIKAKVKRVTDVVANMSVKAKETIKLQGDKTLSQKLAKGKVEGSTAITIISGGSKVVLDKGAIMFESDKDVVISATGKSDLMPGNADLK